MELIPGSEINLDKKKFNWNLEALDESKLQMSVAFNHPEYISMDAEDSIKISFAKTDYFI